MISRLERHLLHEVLVVFFLTASLYVGLFLFGTLLVRSRWLNTLPIAAIAQWLIYQVPNFVLQAFPLSMVFTVLLVFGRLARDHELLAMQLASLSLARVARPVVILAICLVFLGLIMSEFLIPVANQRTALSWWDAVNGGGRALEFIAGRELVIDSYLLHFEGYDASTRELHDVKLEFWQGLQKTIYIAKTATLERNRFVMHGYRGYKFDFSAPNPELKLSNIPLHPDSRYTVVLPQSRDELIAQNVGGGFEDSRALSTLWHEWRSGLEPASRSAGVSLGLKTALPFASLVILLLVIPVAVSELRSLGTAFGVSLLIAFGYYALLTIGQALGMAGIVPSILGPWLANILCLLAGVIAIRQSRLR